MKQTLAAFALVFCLVFTVAATTPPPPIQHEATLLLKFADGGRCSGTAVGPALIVSATHCFAESPLVSVNGKPAHMVSSVTDGNDHTMAVVDIAFSQWASFGGPMYQRQHLHQWGNPLGATDIYREGIVAGMIDGWWVSDFAVAPGDSGSALFDDHGLIVGIVSTVMAPTEYFHLMGAKPLAFTAEQKRVVGL